jgi:integrase
MSWKAETLGIDVPSQEKLLRIVRNINNSEHRTLIVLAYLTAGRIKEILSLRRGQIRTEEKNGRRVLAIYHMLNEKNKKKKTKTFFIPIDKEGELIETIIPFLNTKEKDDKLFNFNSRQRAWQITKMYGFHPHIFRHYRLTHLVTIYNFSDRMLVEFAGWKDSAPGHYYIQLRSEDMLEKMK